jgi:hypothetical protein
MSGYLAGQPVLPLPPADQRYTQGASPPKYPR